MASFPIRYPGVVRFSIKAFDALSNVARTTVDTAFKMNAPTGVTLPDSSTSLLLTQDFSDQAGDSPEINLVLTADLTTFTTAQDGAWDITAEAKVSDVLNNNLGQVTSVGTMVIDLTAGEANDLLPPTISILSTTEIAIAAPLTPTVNVNFANGIIEELPEGWTAGPTANLVFNDTGMTIGQPQPKTYNSSFVSSPPFVPAEGQLVTIEFVAPELGFTPTGAADNAGHVGMNKIDFRNPDAIAWMSQGKLQNGDVQLGNLPGNTVPGDFCQFKILISQGYALCTGSKQVGGAWEQQGVFTAKLSAVALAQSQIVLDCTQQPLTITRVSY